MNGYVCFYNGKRWECYASSMFDAKEKAVAYFKPPKSKQHMVRAVLAKWAAPQPEHDLKDVPCECCGYMTYHREHMGCIRAAAPKAAPGVGNSGFDHQSAADFLSGKTVTADTVRAQLATDGQGQAVANPAIDFPHEEFDAIAATRYKVVAADQSMFWGWAVVAGDGTQQLYVGRKVDCENMARKFAGAFADGSFHAMHAAPQQAVARDALIPAKPELLEALKESLAALEWVVEQGGGPACEHDGGVVCFCKENNAINSACAAISKAIEQ